MEPYVLFGGNGSPYSRKLRAILRYRRLPHIWKQGTPDTLPELSSVRPRLIPVLRIPESGEYRVDSTPLAYLLEERHPGSRSIIPPGQADAFLCHLIEDFADEWLTKIMFHYRWAQDQTSRWAANWVVRDAMPSAHGKALEQAVDLFETRQRGRMALVGSTAETAPFIEASYKRLLLALGPEVGGTRFLFGSRPSLADFALYGQLAQLSLDPWPQSLCRELAPAVEAWVFALDDGSGIVGEWAPSTGDTLRAALLEMIGSEYLPFLVANAAALTEGRNSFTVTLRGQPFTQAPFAYQRKCLADIRQRWRELPVEAKQSLEAPLSTSGCLDIIAGT